MPGGDPGSESSRNQQLDVNSVALVLAKLDQLEAYGTELVEISQTGAERVGLVCKGYLNVALSRNYTIQQTIDWLKRDASTANTQFFSEMMIFLANQLEDIYLEQD